MYWEEHSFRSIRSKNFNLRHKKPLTENVTKLDSQVDTDLF